MIYDFIYDDNNQYQITGANLKNELEKLNIDNNYEYFDYFKGNGFVYFLDKINNKITVVSFSEVSGNQEYEIMKKFADEHKSEFDEIIFANATSMETLKI
ncbi:hypothetical protein NZ698_07670 [Chryseobacterium sp. PBS4-4]|uniref:Uncharacterized protein n=2 Tax=Chryseobacterium edaphi TaxID=2976532 RepID=A0ABT2W4B7_9FLAO|nr:hypothetical protein [Chryseobacterium edaphi]